MAETGVMPLRTVVVGAGPAGIRAAEHLVEAGLRPIVVDEAGTSGGQIYRRQPAGFRRQASELYGFEARKATRLHHTLAALNDLVDYRPHTLAWAVADGSVHLATAGRTTAEPYDALIIAAGATDRVVPVPGWTMPGVFTLGAAQIALKAQGCTVGERPIFVGTGPLLYYAAYQYAAVGVRPAAILDTSPARLRLAAAPWLCARLATLAKGLHFMATLVVRRVPIHAGVRPLRIEGDRTVAGVVFHDGRGRERRIAGDAVALGYGLRSETQLADLAGCRFTYDPVGRQWLPEVDEDGRSSVPNVYLVGDGARALGADAAELAGRLAAAALIADAGFVDTTAERAALRASLKRHRRFREGLERAFPWPARQAHALPDDTLVCRCEAITAGELRRVAREYGASEQNRAKAFSRVGMGRCQGRFCGLGGAEILADALGVPVEAVGRLRGQAPVKPLPMATEAET